MHSQARILSSSPGVQVLPMVVQVYDYCSGDNGTIPHVYLDTALDAVDAMASAINDMLAETVIVVPPRGMRGNMTFNDVRILLQTVSFELHSLHFVNATEISLSSSTPTSASSSSTSSSNSAAEEAAARAKRFETLLPSMYMAISLMQKLLSFVQCETLARHIAAIVKGYAKVVSSLYLACYVKVAFSVVLAIVIVLSFVGAHILDRPRKYYYSHESGRWFRFRAAYAAHKRLWKRTSDSIAQLLRALTHTTDSKTKKKLKYELKDMQSKGKHNLFFLRPLSRLEVLFKKLLIHTVSLMTRFVQHHS